jgi:hypothetical protein
MCRGDGYAIRPANARIGRQDRVLVHLWIFFRAAVRLSRSCRLQTRGRRECVRDTRKPEGKRGFVPSVVQQGKSQGKANTVKGSETGDDETIASVAKP